MNFQVPQFIEIEDKPIGPFTFRQFMYLAGGAGLCFLWWVYMPYRVLAILLILPTAGLALALAFYKINNRPFILIMESAIRYWFSRKLYIWKRVEPDPKKVAEMTLGQGVAVPLPKLSQSKLADLAWSLDVQEKIK